MSLSSDLATLRYAVEALVPVLQAMDGLPGPSAYSVAVSNGFVGTEAEWLASLQGAPGDPGNPGGPGADGDDGDPGTPGTDGDDGAPGASAYDVAVSNGFVGTEPEWLASLVGAPGDPGTPGTDGEDGADGPTLAAVLAAVYPIGCVYTSLVATSPATLFGFGTWAALAPGRVLVGFDATQTEFDTVRKESGAKTHALTVAEMPSHTHVQNAHQHQVLRERSATTGAASTQITRTADTSSTVDANVFTENATAVNQSTGGGSAHNNLQPSFTVYLWERTA